MSLITSTAADEVNDNYQQSMGMLQNRETAYKIALVGDPGVGKSALICRYMDNSIFIEDYQPTIIDTFSSETSLVDPGDGLTRHI